jgi:hypothetical protein
MTKPYVYKITSKNDEVYFGVRWDYTGEASNDLWKKYFTSSTTVKELIIQEGVDYFKPTIVNFFDSKQEALEFEYSLIKENLNNPKLLNKSMGKCTIWNDDLKKQVSNSVRKLWENEEYRLRGELKSSGVNNHNFGIKPWENINSNIESWVKVKKIYEDFQTENWNLKKYGFGRDFVMRRYGVCQGTARKFLSLLKDGWNPLEDENYMKFFEKNALVL